MSKNKKLKLTFKNILKVLDKNNIEYKLCDEFDSILIIKDFMIQFGFTQRSVNDVVLNIDIIDKAFELKKKYIFIPVEYFSPVILDKLLNLDIFEKEFERAKIDKELVGKLKNLKCLFSHYYLTYFELLYKFDRSYLILILSEIKKLIEKLDGRVFKIIPYSWHKEILILKGLKGEIYETEEGE